MLLVVLIELSPADAFLPTDGFPVGVVGADQPLLQLLLVELDVVVEVSSGGKPLAATLL